MEEKKIIESKIVLILDCMFTTDVKKVLLKVFNQSNRIHNLRS